MNQTACIDPPKKRNIHSSIQSVNDTLLLNNQKLSLLIARVQCAVIGEEDGDAVKGTVAPISMLSICDDNEDLSQAGSILIGKLENILCELVGI